MTHAHDQSRDALINQLQERVAKLEERVEALVDQIQIYQLTASYAPAVDSGLEHEVAALWTSEGIYDVDNVTMEGRRSIGKLVRSKIHQTQMDQGCGHVISLPRITIHGDHAVATCHSQLYLHGEDGFRVARVAANRWELVRDGAGWRIVLRTNRLLDGSDAAVALLGQSFAEHTAAQSNLTGKPPFTD